MRVAVQGARQALVLLLLLLLSLLSATADASASVQVELRAEWVDADPLFVAHEVLWRLGSDEARALFWSGVSTSPACASGSACAPLLTDEALYERARTLLERASDRAVDGLFAFALGGSAYAPLAQLMASVRAGVPSAASTCATIAISGELPSAVAERLRAAGIALDGAVRHAHGSLLARPLVAVDREHHKAAHRNAGSACTLYLYSTYACAELAAWHDALAGADECTYVLRPLSMAAPRNISVQGFGVEMALKSTDYLVLDERTPAQAASSAPASDAGGAAAEVELLRGGDSDAAGALAGLLLPRLAERYPGSAGGLARLGRHLRSRQERLPALKSWQITDIGIKAAAYVERAPDFLRALRHVTHNFPGVAHVLVGLGTDAEDKKRATRARELAPSGPLLTINGRSVDRDRVDLFGVLDAVIEERRFAATLSHDGIDAATLSTVVMPCAAAQTASPPLRYNVSAQRLAFWNNIEKDAQYRQFPESLSTLVMPGWPGQLKVVRRNLYDTIFVVDLQRDASVLVRVAQMASAYLYQLVPSRVVIVPALWQLAANESALFARASRMASAPAPDSANSDDARVNGGLAFAQALGYLQHVNRHSVAAFLHTYASLSLQEQQQQQQQPELSTVAGGDVVSVEVVQQAFERVAGSQLSWSDRVSFADMREHRHTVAELRKWMRWSKEAGLGSADAGVAFVNGRAIRLEGAFESLVHGGAVADMDAYAALYRAGQLTDRTSNARDALMPPGSGLRLATALVPLGGAAALGRGAYRALPGPDVEVGLTANCTLSLVGVGAGGAVARMQRALGRVSGSGVCKVLVDAGDRGAATAAGRRWLEWLRRAASEHSSDVAAASDRGAHAASDHVAWSERYEQLLNGSAAALIANGRVVWLAANSSSDDDVELSSAALGTLVQFERASVADCAASRLGARSVGEVSASRVAAAAMAHQKLLSGRSTLASDVFTYTSPGDAGVAVQAIVDPTHPSSRLLASVLLVLRDTLNATVQVALSPPESVGKLPLASFYRHLWAPSTAFDAAGARTYGQRVEFDSLPSEHLFTLNMKTPHAWMVELESALHDLDNVLLSRVPAGDVVAARYVLRHLLVEGHASSASDRGAPPNGLELELAGDDAGARALQDTLVMQNLGYFQLQGAPGVFRVRVAPGTRSARLFEDVNATAVVASYDGATVLVNARKRAGMEAERLLVDSSATLAPDASGGAAPGGAQTAAAPAPSMWSRMRDRLFGSRAGAATEWPADEPVHVFSIASGHLYERFLRIMIASVMRTCTPPVKFWFLANWLSPQFTSSLPRMAASYNFTYELITYKWPQWLLPQTEKQRVIWAYKILFLDVIFPLSVRKVVFVDADQVVRADLRELFNLDLDGKPLAYTPFCTKEKNEETTGFRFWEDGYWRDHLRGKSYHISALYLIDLQRFRMMGAGDQLRMMYQNLAADPNSLSNLDQDLPNYAQHAVPIFSLPEEWLWCETWCSQASKARAKTIDLCNNPLTKAPKLDVARRIIDDWDAIDAEVSAVISGDSAPMPVFAPPTGATEGSKDGDAHADL